MTATERATALLFRVATVAASAWRDLDNDILLGIVDEGNGEEGLLLLD
jgi:hypothetical protein